MTGSDEWDERERRWDNEDYHDERPPYIVYWVENTLTNKYIPKDEPVHIDFLGAMKEIQELGTEPNDEIQLIFFRNCNTGKCIELMICDARWYILQFTDDPTCIRCSFAILSEIQTIVRLFFEGQPWEKFTNIWYVWTRDDAGKFQMQDLGKLLSLNVKLIELSMRSKSRRNNESQ